MVAVVRWKHLREITRTETMKKFLKWMLSGLYGLLMIEAIIMISPFAFYWYSLYSPTLQVLHGWKGTAWLEAFFLPHSVITTSAMLEVLRWQVGTYAFSIGILGFLLCAGQVYGAKLVRGGVVRSWIYSRIRHPQYLFLSIAGFGLLTMWPRIIILVLYIGLLFIYYFLARFEEKQMEMKHADYAEYFRRTAMFIPGSPGGKLFGFFFGWIPNRLAALVASSAVIMLLVIGSALLLRQLTVRHTATELLAANRTLAIAVWPMSHNAIQQIVSVTLHDEQVRSALENEPGAVFTAHILPDNYSMVAMFADVGVDHDAFSRLSPHHFKHLVGLVLPFFRQHHQNRVMGTPNDNYKVIFSRVDGPDRNPVTLSGITGLEAKMTPVVIVNVGGTPPILQSVLIPPRRSLWGDIMMPMF